MSRLASFYALFLLASLTLQGQTLSNSSVNGRYFYRQLEFSTDALGNVTGSVASLGTITFDGNGTFTVSGFQTVGNQQPTTLTGGGAYLVQSSGTMTLSNPQRNGYTVNARLGTELILGSTTESSDNTFDLFAAVPAPPLGQGGSLFSGTYAGASFELQNSVAAGVRSSLFLMPVAGSGLLSNFQATGHAANYLSGAITTQTVGGGSYAIGTDGSGTLSFGGSSALLSGTKNIYVSASGNTVLLGSPYAGGQDLVIGVRQFSGQPTVAGVSGLYFTGGIRLDLGHLSTSAYAGSFNGLSSLAQTVTAQRLHQIGLAPGFDVTLSNPLTINSNYTFNYGLDVLLLGISGNSFVAAGLSSTDTAGYSIDIGIRSPTLTGTGVYIQPQGVVNAASLSPVGAAIAPGEFVSLFGSGLSANATSASLPYPTTVGDASVTVNGVSAPIAYASANQLNFLVPYTVTGSSATIVASNAGTVSNTVVVPLQKTAPGTFSVNGSGTGLGAITHATGAIVSTSNPARRGETIVIYAAGLGAVTPSVIIDGAPGSGSTVNAVAVTIAGQAASVTFAGLSPAYPGLYQINVLIPANLVGTGALPLGIRTIDAFHCQVDLQVQ